MNTIIRLFGCVTFLQIASCQNDPHSIHVNDMHHQWQKVDQHTEATLRVLISGLDYAIEHDGINKNHIQVMRDFARIEGFSKNAAFFITTNATSESIVISIYEESQNREFRRRKINQEFLYESRTQP